MSGNVILSGRKHTSASAPPADINGRRSSVLRSRSSSGEPKEVDEMALGILTGLLRGRLVPRKGLTALTTKRGPKGFYKGKGCKSTGRHTSKGGYVLMAEKLPVYVVPDLTDFKLKAYVAHDTPKVPKLETGSSGEDASPATS